MIATPQTSCACLGCFLSFPHQASIDPKSVPVSVPLWGSGPANTGTFRPFPNRNLHEVPVLSLEAPGVFVRCQPPGGQKKGFQSHQRRRQRLCEDVTTLGAGFVACAQQCRPSGGGHQFLGSRWEGRPACGKSPGIAL